MSAFWTVLASDAACVFAKYFTVPAYLTQIWALRISEWVCIYGVFPVFQATMVITVNIHEAAFNGDYRQLNIALDNGQSPCEKDNTGTSTMHKAAANGHLECLQLLSQRGGELTQPDITGCTPLHAAARNGHLKTVKWLVEAGIDINLQSQKGKTARDVAKAAGYFEVAKFLKEAGREKFDWEKADKYGKLNFVTR
ncbi:ankyrin repeat domain-containing protein 65-like [Acanthaster planci]|uniref:Ankyrin repeat domain-containing protein 65-like n=1 Tax=Acanthaster planci TaxID=133434 RepID=A0A8B7YGV6_ACAPL|nr:ankyrin repeat domain-containing protein 65-like [Acanthaster planci]